MKDNGIDIIENERKLKNNYHLNYWGSRDLILTHEQLNALINGKCLIWNDGEYSHSIAIKECE